MVYIKKLALAPLFLLLFTILIAQLTSLLKSYDFVFSLSINTLFLAVLLFLTLQSLTSVISLTICPLLYILFFVLEKTGFVKFEIEQRPVRKMAV